MRLGLAFTVAFRKQVELLAQRLIEDKLNCRLDLRILTYLKSR